MKSFFVVSILLIILILSGCNDTELKQKNNQIKLVSTSLGGCNINEKDISKSIVAEEGDDLVRYEIKDDSLFVFIGLNYACCSTFETKTAIENDTIKIELKDVCTDPSSCHCKCMCYYTFSLKFTGFENKSYPYQVTLNSPLNGNPVLYMFGVIDISGLNDNLKLVKTTLGGCNNSLENTKNFPIYDDKDTLLYSVDADILNIFVGLQFECCAKYQTSYKYDHDTIIITLEDTAKDLCNCICYYTFDFSFSDFQNKLYYYKVIRVEPPDYNAVIKFEGTINLIKFIRIETD